MRNNSFGIIRTPSSVLSVIPSYKKEEIHMNMKKLMEAASAANQSLKTLTIKSKGLTIKIRPLTLGDMINGDLDKEGKNVIEQTAEILSKMVVEVCFGEVCIKGKPFISEKELAEMVESFNPEEAAELTEQLQEVLGTGKPETEQV